MSQPDSNRGRTLSSGPPDLDELIRKQYRKLKQFLGGKPGDNSPGPDGSAGVIAGSIIVSGLVAAMYVASGFYVVDAREEAVVLRFGKYVSTSDAGLHWRMPWPFESHEIIRLSELRSVDIGSHGEGKRSDSESLMLTQDQNIIDMQLEVQYDVKDSKAFLFNNARGENDSDAHELVKQVAETAIREVVGRNKVDYVLREGRTQIAADTTRLVQGLLDDYGSGVRVIRVNINDVQPPEDVQAAFADTVKAGQDKVKYTNDGMAYANSRLPEANGVASKLLQEAEGHRVTVVARAEGDAARFRKVAAEYAKAPQVTRDRMYIDTMQQILSNSTKIVTDQKTGSGGSLIYLPLDKLMQLGKADASSNQPAVAVGDAKIKSDPSAVVQDVPRSHIDFAARPEREGR